MPIHVGENSGGLVEIGGLFVGDAAGGFVEIAKAWEYRAGAWVELWAPAAGIPSQFQSFSLAGSTEIYQPPEGATRISIIALGGGGGGDDADPDETTDGGEAGQWAGLTLYPPFAPQYYVYVGEGAYANGQASHVSEATGPDAVRMISGAGGRYGRSRQSDGGSPGSYYYGGMTRYGGKGGTGWSSSSGSNGTAPGGGGGGAGDDNSGGKGARGQVWFAAHFN